MTSRQSRSPRKRVIDANKVKAGQGGAASNTMTEKGRKTGKEYTWHLRTMPASEVSEKLNRSVYNQRSPRLSQAAVVDILPSIKADKINDIPGYVVKGKNGNLEVLVGWRRSYAVSLIDGAVFQYWYCSDVEEGDQRAKCGVADLQRAQSPGDRMMSLRELEAEQGIKLSNNEVAEMWGTSDRYVRLIRSYMKIPDALFDLFPDVSLLPKRFLDDVVKLDLYPDIICERIADIAPITDEATSEADLKSLASDKRNEILKALKQQKPRKKAELPDNWKVKTKQGVKLRAGNQGQISINIDTNMLSQEEQAKLVEIIQNS